MHLIILTFPVSSIFLDLRHSLTSIFRIRKALQDLPICQTTDCGIR